MTETVYHGGPAEITTIDRDICLTDDREIAESYVSGRGYLHTVELAHVDLANEDDIRATAETVAQLDPRGDIALALRSGGWTFELIDSAKVRGELTAAGFAGARYADANPDNAVEHDTIRIWATGIAQVISREEI